MSRNEEFFVSIVLLELSVIVSLDLVLICEWIGRVSRESKKDLTEHRLIPEVSHEKHCELSSL
jgi:hypothetical protein